MITNDDYKEYQDLVRGICLEYENNKDRIDDLCQSAWERIAMASLSQSEVINKHSWIATITHNVCKNYVRYQMYRRNSVSLEEINTESEDFLDEETPENLYEAFESVWEKVKDS